MFGSECQISSYSYIIINNNKKNPYYVNMSKVLLLDYQWFRAE